MQLQHFILLGNNAESYNVVVWVTSQFSGPMNNWWLDRKQHVSIPDSFNSPVAEICKTSLVPNIRDDAINAMLGLTNDPRDAPTTPSW
jgi:hypothetical protein